MTTVDASLTAISIDDVKETESGNMRDGTR